MLLTPPIWGSLKILRQKREAAERHGMSRSSVVTKRCDMKKDIDSIPWAKVDDLSPKSKSSIFCLRQLSTESSAS
jgi:hypothetical protein